MARSKNYSQRARLRFLATSRGGGVLPRRCLSWGTFPSLRFQLRRFKPFGGLPKTLQIVKLARLLGKNMHNKIHIVDQNPLALLVTLDLRGPHIGGLQA